jgi:glycerol uptake facilitator-like aquaporin
MAPDDGHFGPAAPATTRPEAGESGLIRTIIAEAAGSGLLTFIVVAAGILAERFAIHNTGLALLMTALAGATGFIVLVRAFGSLAPACFNPALALALTLNGRLKLPAALSIAAIQITTAFLGVMLAHTVTNTGMVQVATQIQSGEGVWLGEFLATTLFILALLSDLKGPAGKSYMIGGSALLAIALVTPSTSFANPAITLARSLTDSFTAIRLSDALMIASIQMLAALGAWALQRWLFPRSP